MSDIPILRELLPARIHPNGSLCEKRLSELTGDEAQFALDWVQDERQRLDREVTTMRAELQSLFANQQLTRRLAQSFVDRLEQSAAANLRFLRLAYLIRENMLGKSSL